MAKRRSQVNKENEAPQTTRSGLQQGLQDIKDKPGEATPMPQARALLEVTPELFPRSPSNRRAPLVAQGSKAKAPDTSPLGAQAEASPGLAEAEILAARTLQLPTPPATPYAVSGSAAREPGPAESDFDEALGEIAPIDLWQDEPVLWSVGPAVRGLDELARIHIRQDEPVAWSGILQGKMPVKNTFIDFRATSPATRAATKELSCKSEPRSLPSHPQPFIFHESKPTAIVDDPVDAAVVIRLQDSLPSRRQLFLADHLGPYAVSQPAALPRTASHGDADASGDTVRRQLFAHSTI